MAGDRLFVGPARRGKEFSNVARRFNSRRFNKGFLILAGLALVAVCLWVGVGTARIEARAARTSGTSSAINTDRIVRYIRERFGVPESVKLTVGPVADSALPGFYQAVVDVDYGEQNKQQNTKQSILVSKDDRYLVIGSAVPLGANAKAEVVQKVREALKVPATVQLTASAFRPSEFALFNQTQVTADDGKKKQSQNFYLSKNDHFLVLGQVFSMNVDPMREALRTIVTQNQPSVGPTTARVTIVEYADLQCPSCAHLHEVLEKQVLPKYGDKIRVIFKEFPLPMHDWSGEAAIANECAYQIEPSAFLNYRTMIFARQSSFTVANVRDLLLQYGQEAGIDRLRLAACMDAKASLPRIEADKREGEKLGVNRTPTSFINGRRVEGAPSDADLYKIIDEALTEKPEKKGKG
ncbi:MAG TPA: DsbA family protein [Terriglobia bacterium]|nr:DsbA family protein [Terriglobia bacterium]